MSTYLMRDDQELVEKFGTIKTKRTATTAIDSMFFCEFHFLSYCGHNYVKLNVQLPLIELLLNARRAADSFTSPLEVSNILSEI